MSEKLKDQIRDHSFDGIQEYDNQLPKWWLWTFVLTVVFSFIYWINYHTYEWQPNQEEELNMAMAAHKENFKSKEGEISNEAILKLVQDQEALTSATQSYMANCMACHAMGGGGMIGPNLTDKYWIHGGQPVDIYKTILKGVPAKGMVPWEGILSSKQIKALTAYIISLEGSNPANAKGPEGELMP